MNKLWIFLFTLSIKYVSSVKNIWQSYCLLGQLNIFLLLRMYAKKLFILPIKYLFIIKNKRKKDFIYFVNPISFY